MLHMNDVGLMRVRNHTVLMHLLNATRKAPANLVDTWLLLCTLRRVIDILGLIICILHLHLRRCGIVLALSVMSVHHL